MHTLDAAVTSVLTPWAGRMRQRANLPLLLRWGPEPGAALPLGDTRPPRVTLHLRHPAAVSALLSPSLDRLGEAYVEGRIDLEGSPSDLIAVAWQLAENAAALTNPADGRMARWMQRVAHATLHSRDGDRDAIQYHYDVSNDFYAAWLDPAMVYSCAYFARGEKRWRIWRMYLIGSHWAFERDQISLYQVLARRAGRSAGGQPWSRNWMLGAGNG
ncbi:MAG: class I SAM-dependent methyltransferase [Burkholderiaceae bacterium]|nr:class I SAM-dependent methyltransferase [Burkholderiaceae bacterium]